MNYLRVICVIIFAASFYNCSKTPNDRLGDNRIVLQVGENKLTLGDLDKQTQAASFTDVKHEYETKKTYVDQYLERFLLIEGAKEIGLKAELDSTVIKRNLLRQFYYKEVTRDLSVTDTDAREFFDHFGGDIQVGHLLVNSEELADSLYIALTGGADFEKLVRQFSKDSSTVDKGGSLGYSQYGRFVEEFEEAAFALKIGEISRPVQTRFGWHIIKLYDRKKSTDEEFDNNKVQYRNLARRRAENIAKTKFKKMVKDKYHFEMITPTLDLLAQKADSAMARGVLPAGHQSGAYLDNRQFTDAEKEAYVVKYDGGGMKVVELLGFMRGFAPEMAPELKEHAIMEDLLTEILVPVLMERMALAEEFEKSSMFLTELESLRGSAQMQKMRESVYASVKEVTEEDIASYYNAHLSEFYFPERIRASAIAVKTRPEAEELLQRIKNGAVFRQLAAKYSVDKRTGADGGDLNYFSVKMYTPIYEAAQGLQIGDVGGPLEYDSNWWIFKLTDRAPKEQKNLDLVRADLRSKLRVEWREKAYSDFIARMKEKTEYKVDMELVKSNLRMGKYEEVAGEPKG